MVEQILSFWFEQIDPKLWWLKDKDFDQLIIRKFSKIHSQATRCELFPYRDTARGSLAEIIILDQFSRNMFRDFPLAFANDSLALSLAQRAIEMGLDQQLESVQRSFLYMPFMHSESVEIHRVAVKLFEANGIKPTLDFEIKHQKIIERFNRYPHRNKILARKSTKEEIEFLKQPDSSF